MLMHQRFWFLSLTYFFLALALRATSKHSVFVSDPLLKQWGRTKCNEASAVAAVTSTQISFWMKETVGWNKQKRRQESDGEQEMELHLGSRVRPIWSLMRLEICQMR